MSVLQILRTAAIFFYYLVEIEALIMIIIHFLYLIQLHSRFWEVHVVEDLLFWLTVCSHSSILDCRTVVEVIFVLLLLDSQELEVWG